MPIFYRHTSIRSNPDDDGILNIVASTDAPVDMGGWREVLDHSDGAVDTEAARSVLFNHDANQIIGSIVSVTNEGGRMTAKVRLLPDVKAPNGARIDDMVKSDALRGVSIGYGYSRDDVEYDKKERTARVNKWRLLEITFTPIPADKDASIRSMPEQLQDELSPVTQADMAEDKGDARMSDPITPPVQPGQEQAESETQIRDAMRREAKEVAAFVRSYEGIDVADVAGMTMAEAKDHVLAEVAKRQKADDVESPAVQGRVVADSVDKQHDAAVDALVAGVFNERADKNPFAGRSIREVAQRWATVAGHDTENWTRKDAAHFALGNHDQLPRGKRDAANVTTDNFTSFVMLDAITKIVAKGYEMGSQNLVYPRLSDINRVPDFKTSRIGGMGTANLEETAENVAFPELEKSEGVFSAAAKMWGGTLSLTLQALINDDTGQFERSLRMAGTIAAKTEEKRAIQKFLLGTSTAEGTSTWTNNTTDNTTLVYTTADLAADARANLYRASIGMMNKIGLDGNPLGTVPRYLLCGPTNAIYANGLLGSAGGQPVANSGQLELLVSPFLELSTLTGYSATSYYLVADPMMVTGLMHTVITGFENVQVQEYDAGAVAARKWKLWKPFEFDLFSVENSEGTTIVPAAQQATT